jgi:predicted GH43/DUF377 family glycosyl hydrolase
MNKLIFCFLYMVWVHLCGQAQEGSPLVIATKRIELPPFYGAFNPSIIKREDGFLLSFRYCPDPVWQSEISYIGIVLLNESLDPITRPELLNTRSKNSKTRSQSEDARLFSYNGRVFLIYNDNIDVSASWERRDMFIAELYDEKGSFSLSTPMRLIYKEKYNAQLWQKNWVPFEWNRTLFISYVLNPHEVLYLNLKNGECYLSHLTSPPIHWEFGTLRGSTPPLLIDGEYLAFFHSGTITALPSAPDETMWYYFMGAYTFSAAPPFEITRMTPSPIMHDSFYTKTDYYKKVVFPGGFVDAGSSFYVAYGKDDREIWIATIDKSALKKALVPISNNRGS